MTAWLALALLAAQPAPAAIVGRAQELYFQGRFDDSLRAYREAVHRSSSDVTAQLNLGVLYRDSGRPADAAKVFASAAELLPEDPWVWNALGEAALQARELGVAQKAFSAALDARPGFYHALLGLGRLHEARSEPALAAERYREAAQARPEAALPRYLLGRALEQQGLLQQARDAYLAAQAKDGQFAEVRLDLGRVYQALARPNEAWTQFAKAADLEPSHAAAAKSRDALKGDITKKPEELIPVIRIDAPRRILPSRGREEQAVLRVAVGTTASGKPVADKAVAFRSSGDFTVELKATGKVLASGKAGQTWVLRQQPQAKTYDLVGPKGEPVATFTSAVWIRLADAAHATLIFEAVPSAKGYAWASLKDRELRGLVEARPHPSGLFLVNHVPLEEYLYGVVAEEMPIRWPEESLKAQAVIARTHALTLLARSVHRDQGYDLCDGQHCQVYGGVGSEYSPTRSAVDETRGLVLKHGDALATTFYSSNCGGHTQNAADIKWSNQSYLRGAPDLRRGMTTPASPWEFELWIKSVPKAFCQSPRFTHPPEFRWSRVVSVEDLSARVNRRGATGRLKSVQPVARSRSGHVRQLRFKGVQGDWTTDSEAAIRRLMGLGPVRSTYFVVETYPADGPRQAEFVLHGAGWGHAVGLCQSGAAGRAADGADFRSILSHYYPGTALVDSLEKPQPPKRPPVPPKKGANP